MYCHINPAVLAEKRGIEQQSEGNTYIKPYTENNIYLILIADMLYKVNPKTLQTFVDVK